jgi:hypothetical protein
VRVAPIERGHVGIRGAHDLHRADQSRDGTARVVQEGKITTLHAVAQEVSRLVVAHPVPAGTALREPGQLIDSKALRFGLEQPMSHGSELLLKI